MYNYGKPTKTSIKRNTAYKGERLEEKINRIVNNKEPITDGAPQIFTERKNGVEAQYNIRTDRFELAVDATDYITKSHLAKREQNIKEFEKKLTDLNDNTTKNENKDAGGKSSQGTENQ